MITEQIYFRGKSAFCFICLGRIICPQIACTLSPGKQVAGCFERFPEGQAGRCHPDEKDSVR